ncbi:unnamed protein product [Ilex paraguariensis]|uniref:Endonuclease/exonuclease/phosphatase domain-containing protein n=1 Tax=Ilex paraguariensis TaxID=185542 RepID=A0ABC8U3U5_9AQUA
MKRASPPLQFLAAAASSDATSTMSSRPPQCRGGRTQWRRGFADRPSGDGRGNQYVTGDSHFRSVRDANRGFRPVETENFSNHGSFRSQPRPHSFNPRARPFHPRPHFYPPPPPLPFNSDPRPPFDPNFPPFNPNQPFRPPPPPSYRNQQFRPQQQYRPQPSKPLDYRNWEHAKPGPPPHFCDRFTVLSYNILADYLAINHRSKLYFHIPRHILDWEWRKRNILFELGLWSADILCFQEVDRFQDLEEELKIRGYSGIWKMRTGEPVDGCAIFWRESRVDSDVDSFAMLHVVYCPKHH